MYYKTIFSLLCGCMFHYGYATDLSTSTKTKTDKTNPSSMHVGVLFLKPGSNNLNYAYWISGNQAQHQSWHAQMLNPSTSPAFELGFNYAVPQSTYSASVDWMHLSTSDSAFKKAPDSINPVTLEVVAPPFEMSPPVFGIRRADSTVKFHFDDVNLNLNTVFDVGSHLRTKVFGGLNVLRINQNLTTVFSDFPGAIPTPYSYALPPDPSFSFQLAAQSKYVGAGPDLGLSVEYPLVYGFGLIGQALGTITAGTTSTLEQFTATSAKLTSDGIGTSHQEITTPNKTQIVPGADGKLGVFYHYSGRKLTMLTIEGGYRILSYANAITTITPNTLVQPGTVNVVPEFSTGTMAIVSVANQDRPFNMNGPYIDLKIALD